jgi:hypothetical protein
MDPKLINGKVAGILENGKKRSAVATGDINRLFPGAFDGGLGGCQPGDGHPVG